MGRLRESAHGLVASMSHDGAYGKKGSFILTWLSVMVDELVSVGSVERKKL